MSPDRYTCNGIVASALLGRDRAGITGGICHHVVGRYTCICSEERKNKPDFNSYFERKGDSVGALERSEDGRGGTDSLHEGLNSQLVDRSK